MMLFRLLRDVDPSNYCLISTQDLNATDRAHDRQWLPGRYFQIKTKYEIPWEHRPLKWRDAQRIMRDAWARARQITRIVKEQQCAAVLSCSSGDDLLDVPSGYLASRQAKVPFFLYLFDTYAHMWTQPPTQFIGQWLEPAIVKRAAGVIATNESVRDLLRRQYGVDSLVIHNPCDLEAYANLSKTPRDETQVKIVYTGAIYDAHYEAFRNLMTAIDMLGFPAIKAHVYTAQPEAFLAGKGVRGPIVYHEHAPIASIPQIQHEADVLFLPLSFTTPYPELIKVSSPSKVGEYLAARRPILVHAPTDSFIANYFRQHDCGVVVDKNDPAALAAALKRILDDNDLRERLSANAYERAQKDFSLAAAQEKFVNLFGLSRRPLV